MQWRVFKGIVKRSSSHSDTGLCVEQPCTPTTLTHAQLWAVHDQQIEDLALYNNVDVPSSCPLHRSHNQYHFQVQSITVIITHQQTLSPHVSILQEQHVTPLRASQWQCELCSKKFKTREYIDIHLDNKHRGDVDEVMSNSSS